eukprot:TRINITY_DN65389_c0_g1_i1.p2 TRINITY_DN65389_c0_g1~~TRINITY_DN65389_c0_g1_i1.p2  ORF type:complete len:102 (+),score=0.85 TRINITY_DN65389_c0_g1_i1:107-412(+)
MRALHSKPISKYSVTSLFHSLLIAEIFCNFRYFPSSSFQCKQVPHFPGNFQILPDVTRFCSPRVVWIGEVIFVTVQKMLKCGTYQLNVSCMTFKKIFPTLL